MTEAGKQNQPRNTSDGKPALPSFSREALTVLLSYALSATLLASIFPPRGLWPLAFVCLVPWAVTSCRTQRAWLVHWLSFLVGSGFFMLSLRWLMPVTGLGYAALAMYLAVYWTLTAWAIRTGRRHGISPMWSLPFVWVACEFLRAVVMTGFPWLFIAHGLYAQLALIQISDVFGAYGVSFLAVLVNGVLVEFVLQRWPAPGPRRPRWEAWLGAGVALVLVAATLGYGHFRLQQVDFANDASRRGPRVAVVQEDFPLVSTPPYGQHAYVILARYLALGAEAAREQPDLLVFPETVWAAYQNIEYVEATDLIPEAKPGSQPYSRLCHEATSAFARGDYPAVNAVISALEATLRVHARSRPDSNLPEDLPRLPAEGGPAVTVLVGAVSIEQSPEATYPKARFFNSALIYDRDGKQRRQRYDKTHLVPFGEFVPFRQAKLLGFSLHWLYRWLNRLSPFSDGGRIEYSLTPGNELTVFELESAAGRFGFGTPICYEDATPYVIRDFVWDGDTRRVDFLVNISNDGWFLHSNELPQHLAICAFRAVENRVGIARAVNTGISAFIDPDGRIYARVERQGRDHGPGVVGYRVAQVYSDDRASLYGRYGDWFAILCLLPATALWLGAVFERWVLAAKERIALLLRRGGG